ncbi:FimV/HubP family polar landmark protein [Pseudoduganella ginsengisoli]|uniref:FimV/HubP family polar landmark protein n=1 Tax=Pseudoduganella ginsengisoli TaxID=1462440 RepID=UPI001E2C3F26|nr:FimV/HubP family polar landmark protein [Pseudoduganella ginsengisoli]
MLSPVANAAGLGKLTVLSSLGQPLRAEIELTAVGAEESSDLTAKLAPAEAFRLANIDFNPALLSLRFEVDNRNGRQFIRVSSSQPINEPFVDMLLELSWTGGRLVREYTFLLDPAEMRNAQSPQVAAPVDLPARTSAPPAQAPRAAAPRPAREPAPAPAREPAAPREGGNEYHVKPGDTLGKIARQLKPVDVSLDMMLVALYRANPEAFAGNNMNRLKSGQILSVPDSDAIKGGASESEAHGVVIAHAADFNAYRNKLAGQVASSTPVQGAESGQSAAGKITAKVEERATPANEAKDQLKLSKATGGEGGKGKTAKASEEDKIAREKQVAEANARVKELEKNVTDLEKLMAVKNKAMADKQKAASASAPAASAPVVASVPVEAPPPAPKKPAKPVITEPSLMDTVMDNIQLIGAGLVAVLGGAGLIAMRRRRAAAQDTPKADAPKVAEVSVLGDPGAQAQPLIAETGGQSVDTNNSVFNSNFAPSASQLDTNEVDPVAEADVYIAYGRDAQAEEILKEALRTHPERHPVRLKLMEIFSNRKDARSFEAQASELYSMTKGQGDEWAQAAAMGLALDPGNPLYAGSGGAAGSAVAAETAPAAAAEAPLSADDFASMFAEPEPVASVAPAAEAHDFSGLDLDLSSDATATGAAATEAPVSAMDFSLDDLTALPSLDDTPAVTQAPIPAAEAEHFLDFDLGGLNMDTTQAPSAAPAEPAAAEPFDLAFDMEAPPAAATEAPAAEPAPLTADDFAMDFGLDLPTTAPAVDLPAPVPEVAADPLAELDMMDFNLPGSAAEETAAPQADVAVAEPALAADDFSIPDFPELDVAATQAPSAPPTAADFDLSGIDLDLIGSNAKLATPAEGGEEMSALQMEMDTKLDLAIAYQEIGDKEGARELLDEVIRGGTGDQVNRATAMRAALG